MKHLTKFVLIALLLAGLIPGIQAQTQPETVTLTIAGFAVSREVYGALSEEFKAYWREETGQTVIIQESYQASGALSRAIEGGLDVDIAAFQLDPEVTRLVDAGLITHDWREVNGGYISNSVVVFAVRPDNPKDIQDWADLAGDDIEIVLPNPGTSGGARWMFLGAYGAAQAGQIEGYEGTPEGVTEYLSAFIENIGVLDRDGRESFLTFESGIGDATITYENEIYAALEAGSEIEGVYPTSTVLIQHPLVLIDAYVDEHDNREVAEAFIEFARSPAGQQIYIEHGYRPTNADVIAEVEADEELSALFPPIENLFTVEEAFGGWSEANKLFGDEGEVTQLIAEIKGQ